MFLVAFDCLRGNASILTPLSNYFHVILCHALALNEVVGRVLWLVGLGASDLIHHAVLGIVLAWDPPHKVALNHDKRRFEVPTGWRLLV